MNKPTQILVWDPFVRLFHWLLLTAFAISWYTQEEYYSLHLQAGYAVLGLVTLRIIWGLFGSKHARFSDFVYSPGKTISYIKSVLHGQSKRFIGHNPAAGVMIIILFFSLLCVTISGIALDGAENWSGPMAQMNLFHYRDLILSIHDLSTDSLLLLIALHLLGVVHTSVTHRENLVLSMLNGRKRSLEAQFKHPEK